MKDRDLIELIYEKTISRITDIREAVSREADEELRAQIGRGDWPELEGVEIGPMDPERETEIARFVWGAPLTDLAVHLMWGILAKAPDGEFVVDETSIAEVRAALDMDELKDSTGIADEHLGPVLERLAEAFIEIVRAHGTVETAIDGTPFRLVAAP